MGEAPPELRLVSQLDGGWNPIPDWASFYVQLGRTLSGFDPIDTRVVVGISVPTRTLAAVLSATGIILGRSSLLSDTNDAREHFEQLCRLGADTPLLYYDGTTLYKARFDSTREEGGSRLVRIRLTRRQRRAGDWTEYRCLPLEQCLRIRRDTLNATSTDLAASRTQVRAVGSEEFLESLLPPTDALNLITTSRLDCLLVGMKDTIANELTELKFSSHTESVPSATGVLQDIVRTRSLTPDRHFRSDVLPERARSTLPTDFSERAHTVIFDSPTAFCHWHESFRLSNWVTVLDPVDRSFRDAVDILTSGFLARTGNWQPKLATALPRSIELVSFVVPTCRIS